MKKSKDEIAEKVLLNLLNQKSDFKNKDQEIEKTSKSSRLQAVKSSNRRSSSVNDIDMFGFGKNVGSLLDVIEESSSSSCKSEDDAPQNY